MIKYWYRATGKRWLDLVVAAIALVVLSPLFLIVTVLIRISLGSPIFFCQQRPGLNGRSFIMYKFRTMSNARDNTGKLLPDGERLTPVGRFLRNMSLDELPELINVLLGDMSLVGPRPWLMQYLERYTTEQMRRHEVRPGITGLAQVNGRNTILWKERIELDIWYVDHVTIWIDIKILSLTVLKVLRREGIHQDGYATTSEFTGTE